MMDDITKLSQARIFANRKTRKLFKLVLKHQDLAVKIGQELARLWPLEKDVLVRLTATQRNLSPASVIGFEPYHGRVVVRLNKKKIRHGIEMDYGSVKRVRWKDVYDA